MSEQASSLRQRPAPHMIGMTPGNRWTRRECPLSSTEPPSRPNWTMLRIREEAHTHEGDAIAAARRWLPRIEVDATTPPEGSDGQLTLLDAFEGRRQLIAYYFRWHTAIAPPNSAKAARGSRPRSRARCVRRSSRLWARHLGGLPALTACTDRRFSVPAGRGVRCRSARRYPALLCCGAASEQ
jgi:hypothetical protein